MANLADSPRRWTFVHLSDIHFRARLLTGEDVFNEDIRDQLLLDLKRLKIGGQHVDAILVSGDIAFSGKAAEYEQAREFLNEACKNLNLPQPNVWMIPGNHDVDRSLIPHFLKSWHARMKDPQTQPDSRQRELDTVVGLEDKVECQRHLLSTLVAYNDFARRYQCESKLTPLLRWESSIGELDHGVVIKLRGMNSAFLCNENDVLGPTTMVGQQQMIVPEEENSVSIIMCHHPQTWLADGTDLMRHLTVRSNLALFGHEHKANVYTQDKLMVLHAGAVNPEQRERATASYNIVTLWVDHEQKLSIEVRQRYFSREEQKFVPQYVSGSQTRMHQQPLNLTKVAPAVIQPGSERGETQAVPKVSEALLMRSLTFFLLDLNEGARIAVMNSLKLFTSAMGDLDGRNLYFAVIDEAKKRDQLLDLWHEVKKYHPEMPAEPEFEVGDA